tara:strand:+ start:451 stop:888 length:438 start_codon:yes stop_codon:yes gene_type:complete
MSSLSSEVADELNKRTKEKVSPEVKISWWRKAIIIFMANCFATLIAGGLLGFFAILWTKANSTDDIAAQLQQHQVMSEAARGEILKEVAKLQAYHEKNHGETFGPPAEFPAEEPTASEVAAAEERLKQKVDKAIYRQQQGGPSSR